MDSIDKRLLEHLDQDDGVRGPLFPSLGDRGLCTFYINIDLGRSALERYGHQRV
jgi:hypothetical protein